MLRRDSMTSVALHHGTKPGSRTAHEAMRDEHLRDTSRGRAALCALIFPDPEMMVTSPRDVEKYVKAAAQGRAKLAVAPQAHQTCAKAP